MSEALTAFGGKVKLLNLACGSKISNHGDWVNVDFASPVSNVISMNIVNGINFPSNSFDAVYSAQFVEHLDLDQAEKVLREVHRVLKPGGVIRLVTPDLEELTNTYLQLLHKVQNSNDKVLQEQYDWIRTEIFDQIVRDVSGGEMATVLESGSSDLKGYLEQRIGHSFHRSSGENINIPNEQGVSDKLKKLKKVPGKLWQILTSVFSSEDAKVGKFRRSGEIHRYMHDLYSLNRVMEKAGFQKNKRVDVHTSQIPQWAKYQLDVIDGVPDGPYCLFVEAVKE